MDINISMQQLKQQSLTPVEKFVLEKIKGVKAERPYDNGDVEWWKGGVILFIQNFRGNVLYVEYNNIWSVLQKEYSLSYGEIRQLLTKLLYNYTNNGQLEVW